VALIKGGGTGSNGWGMGGGLKIWTRWEGRGESRRGPKRGALKLISRDGGLKGPLLGRGGAQRERLA